MGDLASVNSQSIDSQIQAAQARLQRLQQQIGQAQAKQEQTGIDPAPLLAETMVELTLCLEKLQAASQDLRQHTAATLPAAQELELAIRPEVRPEVKPEVRPEVRPEVDPKDDFPIPRTGKPYPERLALELTDVGWWDWEMASDQFTWSDRLFRLLGYGPGEVTPSLAVWRDRIHPNDRDWIDQMLHRDLVQGVGEVEYRVVHPDGSLRWLLVKSQKIFDADGQPQRLLGIALDITDRKQAEGQLHQTAELDAFWAKLSDALRPLTGSAEIQATASRLLGEYLGASRVLYFEMHDNHYVVEQDYVNGVSGIAGRYPIEAFGEEMLAAYRAGRSFVVADVSATHPSPELQAAYAAVQIAAYIAVPIMRGGEFVAGLAVHSASPRIWQPDEIALATRVAEQTWIEIDYVRSTVSLHQRENLISGILGSIADVVFVLDQDWRFSFANDEFLRLTGYSLSDVIGQKFWEVFPEMVDSAAYQPLHQAMAEQIDVSYEFYLEGLQRWFSDRVYPMPALHYAEVRISIARSGF